MRGVPTSIGVMKVWHGVSYMTVCRILAWIARPTPLAVPLHGASQVMFATQQAP